MRFLTIMILTLCTKFFSKHHLSWKECLLATCGGFKGSICLILALALASEYQLAETLLDTKPSKFKVKLPEEISSNRKIKQFSIKFSFTLQSLFFSPAVSIRSIPFY